MTLIILNGRLWCKFATTTIPTAKKSLLVSTVVLKQIFKNFTLQLSAILTFFKKMQLKNHWCASIRIKIFPRILLKCMLAIENTFTYSCFLAKAQKLKLAQKRKRKCSNIWETLKWFTYTITSISIIILSMKARLLTNLSQILWLLTPNKLFTKWIILSRLGFMIQLIFGVDLLKRAIITNWNLENLNLLVTIPILMNTLCMEQLSCLTQNLVKFDVQLKQLEVLLARLVVLFMVSNSFACLQH